MGASVVFLGTPQSVPGFFEYQKREQLLKAFAEEKINKVYSLNEMEIPLKKAGVIKEELVKEGLKFIRREHRGEKVYYVVNHTPKKIEGFVSLGVPAKEVLILDPLSGKTGKAITEHQSETTKVKLSLPSGASLFLKTFGRTNAPKWEYYKPAKNSYKIIGNWNFKLIKGGPDIDFSKSIMVGDSPSDMALADQLNMMKVRILNDQFEFDNQHYTYAYLGDFVTALSK